MNEVVNESLYDEVVHHREDFMIGDNQSYASAQRLSLDKNMKDDPKLSKTDASLSKHHWLLPTTVIILAVIVSALCIFTIVAYFEMSKLSSQINQLQLSSVSSTLNLSSMIDNTNIELNDSVKLASLNYVMLETQVKQLQNDTHELIRTVAKPLSPLTCADILSSFPSARSGFYWFRSMNGLNVLEYCDMTLSCGGVTGGWMRVAELDMRDNTTQCPSSLTLNTDPFHTCRININSLPTCASQIYTLNATSYSHVCGKIIAYQFGSPDAFHSFATLDSVYVDGISLTRGRTRQHIWTFAAARSEDASEPLAVCPCINTASSAEAGTSPAFVGKDYFCDTAAATGGADVFYADDPLWDGAGCGPQNTCCSFNTPPWFYKKLPLATTDYIEMRVCRDDISFEEDISLQMLAIYVQ